VVYTISVGSLEPSSLPQSVVMSCIHTKSARASPLTIAMLKDVTPVKQFALYAKEL